MRALVVVLLLFALPAWAQGLTPAAQVGSFCQKAMRYRALGFGNVTAINNACGNQAAIDATVAEGRPGLDALLALIVDARAARDTRLQDPAP